MSIKPSLVSVMDQQHTFTEEEPSIFGVRPFVGHLMQGLRQDRGPTEELSRSHELRGQLSINDS